MKSYVEDLIAVIGGATVRAVRFLPIREKAPQGNLIFHKTPGHIRKRQGPPIAAG
jgi:hypothetical protein